MSNLMKRNGFWPATSTVDQFLNDSFFNWRNEMSGIAASPKTNIRETDDEFLVEMAAPGMKRDDFHVELDNDMLKIWTEKEQTNEDNNESYTRREFSYESFSRSFYLPNTVEADKIKAKYEDGMLRLMIPKKEEAKRKPPRTIKIS
ncbi:Hsp20/alpha crystallin family protein [Antarcticibacterium flavum]|uniref:Hsp20/alpha crystallin family protein n=1 Tax=Antarcticibacterium flavum TaxID=2058175 RepID=A0A5B7X2N3_9FLAO|nr:MULTISPECIES: Hsp20/alpha crystallin family protein [Antarcticibacterium]MCM4160113.1 heat-shock protein Hsp20 [Antarcticibacterium sp. W02-3]QCY69667.1 Hsp20/alpha crystallin family protein [Antarcticibacterium flavum]